LAKFCNDECEHLGAICDFCVHYDFNGDEDGTYTGDGWCRKLQKSSEPHYGCDEFVCFRIEKLPKK
jgi:hypothetical protein